MRCLGRCGWVWPVLWLVSMVEGGLCCCLFVSFYWGEGTVWLWSHVLIMQWFICQLIWWVGGGGGGSHGCGRPVMLSLNVLIFCFYYGLEWYSYVWRWPVLRYLHDLLVKWSTMMVVWSKALPKVSLNPGRGMLESCQWLGVRQWFPLDATVYATCHSWQTMTAIL